MITKHFGYNLFGKRASQTGVKRSLRLRPRKVGFESLETRWLLDGITFVAPPANVAIGAPVLVAFNDTNTSASQFTATVSDPSKFSATVMSTNNPVLRIVTDKGTMDIQLLKNLTPRAAQHMIDLINAGSYNTGAKFYRIIETFMSQGGLTGAGAGASFSNELNADLRFTSSGLLAYANHGADSNGSEFFITNPNDGSDGFLDYRYTIFGKLIKGEDVRDTISKVPVHAASQGGEVSVPDTAPLIQSMSIVTDSHDGVVMIKALPGATGTGTVTLSDGLGNSQQMTINVGADSFAPPRPWVLPINTDGSNQVTTPMNTAVTITPQGAAADTTPYNVAVQVLKPVKDFHQAFIDDTDTADETDSASISLTPNGSSYIVTPSSGFTGLQGLLITAQSTTPQTYADPVYRSLVPVFVAPLAPQIASISAGGQVIGNGLTVANNSTSGSTLSFVVSNVLSGAQVSIYMDGSTTALVTGTVGGSATSITLTTNGASKLADGAHQFTAKQSITTTETTLYTGFTSNGPSATLTVPATPVVSSASSAVPLTIGLQVAATPSNQARVGQQYTYTVQTNAISGDTVTVTPVTMPNGMQFNSSTNTFTWTPTSAQNGTAPTLQMNVADALGHSATVGPVSITVGITIVPVDIPVNATYGGFVTIGFNGSQAVIYNNLTGAVLSNVSFGSSDTVQVNCPDSQANIVVVLLPSSPSSPLPAKVLVQGGSNPRSNQIAVQGTAGSDTFVLADDTVTANGLAIKAANVQGIGLSGGAGDDSYQIQSSSQAVAVVDTAGFDTLDFSKAAAGVTMNLGLDQGQAQTFAPSSNMFFLVGAIDKAVGSAYADNLTGGNAATTILHGGAGNDTLTGGNGNCVLLADSGSDTLTGGKGKNLLIAGTGGCTLRGGGTQNLLIGGSTNFDGNDAMLAGLMNEGGTALYGYSVRRLLASSVKNASLIGNSLKVQDNGAHNVLYGSGSNNWYMPGKNDTVIRP